MSHVSRAAFAAALLTTGALGACMQTPAPPPKPTMAAVARCRDLDFPIYFERGSDHLSADARKLLASAAGQTQGCKVISTEVTGLTPANATAADLDLSKKRAIEVAQVLAGAGLPAPGPEAIDTRAARPGVSLARRVAHVAIHLQP